MNAVEPLLRLDGVETFYGSAAREPGFFDQLSGYGIPYTAQEQGPLIARGVERDRQFAVTAVERSPVSRRSA